MTRSIARDLARREQLRRWWPGRLGVSAATSARARGHQRGDGDVMAREQVEVETKEGVLTSLGAATSRLREKLGESLASIQKFDVLLPRATTASLDALHAYSLALDEGRVVPRVEAIPHLERAIDLDPNFALAQALLSGVYANTGRSAEAPAFALRAFELRDRVSERERFFISWRYYSMRATGTRHWSWRNPGRRSIRAKRLRSQHGIASAAFGRHDRAVDAFREAIRSMSGSFRRMGKSWVVDCPEPLRRSKNSTARDERARSSIHGPPRRRICLPSSRRFIGDGSRNKRGAQHDGDDVDVELGGAGVALFGTIWNRSRTVPTQRSGSGSR